MELTLTAGVGLGTTTAPGRLPAHLRRVVNEIVHRESTPRDFGSLWRICEDEIRVKRPGRAPQYPRPK